MTKPEAIEAMKRGEKITHIYFDENEWMTLDGSNIVLEDGCRCDIDEFFLYRQNKAFDDGYSIYHS